MKQTTKKKKREAIHSITNWEAMWKKFSLGCQDYNETFKDWIEQHALDNEKVYSLSGYYKACVIKRSSDQVG